MFFKILKKSKKSRARIGIIETEHGVIHTPAFFPVATQACLKVIDSEDIKRIGFNNVLCNTYHLMLRPGSKLIKKMGGLHKFMNFDGVITTDSGGFQVFSLGSGIGHKIGKIAKDLSEEEKLEIRNNKSSLVKITEKGVYFRSYLDGGKHFLGPEESMKIQKDLGADIIFAFDECTSPLDDFEYTKKAMERTHRWAERCLAVRRKKEQALFGIVQGGNFKELRQESAKFMAGLNFDGFGIGGSFGDDFRILDWSIPYLPENKPRHFLGIGYLKDLEKAVRKGIDLFDCVYPTRMARHGAALTSMGMFNLNRPQFLNDKKALDKNCSCPTCQHYTRSYLSHLFRAKEITGMRLLTIHNLVFFKNAMDVIREKIKQGRI